MSAYQSSEPGPFRVLLQKGDFVDSARAGRIVPYKIYYPADYNPGKAPVILWSHGFGGNRDGASFLSRYLASYGYVLMHITHQGTDSSLWEGQKGHPWDILTKISISRETTLARFADVPFVLGQLSDFATENPDVGRVMDLENLGISGHSFGAMTTQVMAGQMFPGIEGALIRAFEPRFRAGILYSPVPIRHLLSADIPDAEIYGPIALPLLHMTGTQDDSPLEGFGYKERLRVYEHSGHPEKSFQIIEDGDHMIYNGTRGKLGENPLRGRHEDLIKITALAYWDAYLKEESRAKNWLAGSDARSFMEEDGTFQITQK
ncbi:MAG: hypothetical protein IT559_09615 [Alphaproteobacteria bacterium]|nr:hypothetical protein [Alphaproteobacteria bacterium]